MIFHFNKKKISSPLIRLLAITSPVTITEKQIDGLFDKEGNKITIEKLFEMLLFNNTKVATLREIIISWNKFPSIKTLQKASSS